MNLKSGSYYIHWVDHIRLIPVHIQKETNGQRAFIITNETIFQLYQDFLNTYFPNIDILRIPDGESEKKLSTVESLTEKLLILGADRKSILISLGGGVVGDITGFLASVYMRGVPYIQIPTTLLSMVDSSVGGKTGVNSKQGKNMIGAFYQPRSVWICMGFIKTLPEREFRCGLAETVKSALIYDKKLYDQIRAQSNQILNKDLLILRYLSYKSISVKKWVVQKDEKEKNLRMILNLGHTLAHSLEKYLNYQWVYHGEAVSIGICFSAFYSFRKGFIQKQTWKEIQELLDKLNLPTSLGNLVSFQKKMPDAKVLIDLMKNDKKNEARMIRFIFLDGIGKYHLPHEVEIKEIQSVLESFLGDDLR